MIIPESHFQDYFIKVFLLLQVCLNKLEDIQLALVIARLYESELDDALPPANLRRIFYEECLGCQGAAGDNYDPDAASPDPFVRSMAFWMLKDYAASLGTLMETNVGAIEKMHRKDKEGEAYLASPSVFNFYNYLRAHPLLVRQQIAATAADKSQTVLLSGFSKGNQANTVSDKNVTYVDRITPIERTLYFATAHSHFKSGCPMLALEVLSKLPNLIDMETDVTKSRSTDNMKDADKQLSTGRLEEQTKAAETDWSKPVTAQNTDSLDWSQPVSSSGLDWSQPVTSSGLDWSQPVKKFDDDELKLDWESDNDEDDEDKDTKSDGESECKEKHEENIPDEAPTNSSVVEVHDIMAQQLRFIACLKIMMEELSTLATGFEVDGGQLRFQLFIWLEKEVDVLKKLTSYGHNEATESSPAPAAKPEGEEEDKSECNGP